MGFEVCYYYHEKIDGGYDKDELKTFKKKVLTLLRVHLCLNADSSPCAKKQDARTCVSAGARAQPHL